MTGVHRISPAISLSLSSFFLPLLPLPHSSMSHTLLASGYGGEIATLHLDLTTKHFVTASTIQSGRAPTWLTLHPTLPVVYTGDEFAEPQGEIHAFTIDPKDGALSPLDTRKVGAGPVHFVISKGKHLYSANYGGGSLSTVALKEDGSFGEDEGEHFQYEGSGPHKERQEAPHTHGVYVCAPSWFRYGVARS